MYSATMRVFASAQELKNISYLCIIRAKMSVRKNKGQHDKIAAPPEKPLINCPNVRF